MQNLVVSLVEVGIEKHVHVLLECPMVKQSSLSEEQSGKTHSSEKIVY